MTWDKIMGGESELPTFPYSVSYTDCGRSSLRLILSSSEIKLIALPNFLCDVIVDVVNEFKIEIAFYHVDENLSILEDTISSRADAVFVINYFGQRHKKLLKFSNKMIIEDNVFLAQFENTHEYSLWASFNSYRKISNCAEGSLVLSNWPLDKKYFHSGLSPFVEYKYKAKAIKFEYFNKKNKEIENQYVELFKQGENVLNAQREIYSPSPRGFNQIVTVGLDYEKEKENRKENYSYLESIFKQDHYISIHAEFYSFFILKIDKRDMVRQSLFESNIFLPVHWKSNLNQNELERRVLSIPLDSRYTLSDFEYVGNLINSFL